MAGDILAQNPPTVKVSATVGGFVFVGPLDIEPGRPSWQQRSGSGLETMGD